MEFSKELIDEIERMLDQNFCRTYITDRILHLYHTTVTETQMLRIIEEYNKKNNKTKTKNNTSIYYGAAALLDTKGPWNKKLHNMIKEKETLRGMVRKLKDQGAPIFSTTPILKAIKVSGWEYKHHSPGGWYRESN